MCRTRSAYTNPSGAINLEHFNPLVGKLTTARRVLRTQGVAGIMSVLKEQHLNNWVGRQIDWWYGKTIEIRGNVVSIDGCTFSLESSVIATKSKSRFMFN